MKNRVLKVNPSDNVIVALTDLKQGEVITFAGNQYEIKEDISAKHKFFMQDLPAGADVIMYGVLIGKTQSAVLKGSRLSTENVKHA